MSGRVSSLSALQVPGIRIADTIDLAAARRTAQALEVWRDGMDARSAADAVANELAQLYRDRGMPERLRDLDVAEADPPAIAEETIKNFNAREASVLQRSGLNRLRLLKAAW